MKRDKHPVYKKVVFEDSSTGKKAVILTTAETKETIKYKGEDLPFISIPVSASSHQFFVGGQQIVDTEGRVSKFTKRYQTAQEQQKAKQEVNAQAATAKAKALASAKGKKKKK